MNQRRVGSSRTLAVLAALLLSVIFQLSAITRVLAQGNFEGVSISASVDRREITIGDEIIYTVTVTHPEGVTVDMPPFASNLGSFEIKDYRRPDPVTAPDGTVTRSVVYVISAFVTGEYSIPPTSIGMKDSQDGRATLETEAIKITVKSVADSPEDLGEIRDIRSPLQVEEEKRPVWIWVVAALAVALLIWLLYRRFRSKPQDEEVELLRIPPHQWFLEELAAMRERGIPGPGGAREFIYALSEMMRRYLGLLVPAAGMDQLTCEFLDSLTVSGLLEMRLVDEISAHMEEHDFVKFAKENPEDERCLQEFDWAEKLAAETEELSLLVYRRAHAPAEDLENGDEGSVER